MIDKLFRIVLLLALVVCFGLQDSFAQKGKTGRVRNPEGKFELQTHAGTDGALPFLTVSGDPLNSRIYTLKNGLTVFMTVNSAEPRIYTSIAVRAGSKDDPADATGLAHYLEHMLFKGTDKYGSLNYKKEEKLLAEIEELYEKYRMTTDEAERKALYSEIDRVSGEAAEYAIANEYDKMLAAIGAKGTNAYTSFEQTVYINDIPSNQLEKWLTIESERFRNPVLRLFHTELEAVYEEKNISLDSDRRAHWTKMMEEMFPRHNYGQQTTIGTIEHLKNPSIKKIKAYYENYYVPNNMAICISGDFDPDQAIEWIEQKFGYFQSKSVTPYDPPSEAPLTKVKEVSIEGPEAESVMIGYRFPGVDNDDTRTMEVIDMLLSNSTAGLIDLNLNQQQKVLRAYSFPMTLKDYSIHMFQGNPKEGQSLEELRDLLLAQIEMVKKGQFEESQLRAIINNMEIQQMEMYENNWGRTSEFVEAFTSGQAWEDYVQRIPRMKKITKEDVVRVANEYYKKNYVVVYKRKGERSNQKVEKPEITPVAVNREAQSDFLKGIVSAEAPPIAPRFVDYNADIQKMTLNAGVPLHYVRNNENSLFTMYYLLDIGSVHDPKLAFALEYLPYLGTDQFTAEEISKKFFELGLSYDVFTAEEEVYVYLSGLSSSYEEGVQLFEHLLNHAKADPAALRSLVENTLKSRENDKLEKYVILRRAMLNYGMYGAENPFNTVISEEELKKMDPQDLVDKIHDLTGYEHRVLYYGPDAPERVATILKRDHILPENLRPAPAKPDYQFQKAEKNKVYFVHYDDMVQAEILWLTRSVDYDAAMVPKIRLFNEYYGGGMSSIVFQTIRESKALAYSTRASFNTPRTAKEPYSLQAYVGTQADKLHEAMAGMMELLEEMPKSENLLEGAKAALRNQIETERIIRTNILFSYESAMRHGVDRDLRADVYNALDGMGFEDVQQFHKDYVAGKNYNILILGSRDNIDLKSLEQYGEVTELSLEQIFGY